MQLVNLQIENVILHEVFKRGNDGNRVPPIFGTDTEELDQDAIDALRDRVVTAMTSTTRCVLMSISQAGVESMVTRVAQLADADEATYIGASRGVADKLADEQKSRAIPGGVVVVFRGSAGVPARRLIGVIKAEVHNGFTREMQDGKAILKFLKSLMLTAQTKLYKVGLFYEVRPTAAAKAGARWDAYIYDETLTVSNRYGAAKYFYDGFLGLAFPDSSARQTSQFHEHTKAFIQAMTVPEEEKIVLHNALVTYLKADQTPTVGIGAFADAYFADDVLKDLYQQHMEGLGFPDTPVNKDLSDLTNQLRVRRLDFHKIRVTGPAEDFVKLVQVDVIDGEPTETGQVPKWTRLIIKDLISGQG